LKHSFNKRTFLLSVVVISFLIPLAEWIRPERPTPPADLKSIQQLERFSPSLLRIDDMNGLLQYTDSVYGHTRIQPKDTMRYVNHLAQVIKMRFYHGYSYHRFGFNTIGWALAPLIKSDLSATVLPDHILKFSYAACSQQSIVFFEALTLKKLTWRKVGLGSQQGGHFATEVWWNNQWHFYDVNKEPHEELLIPRDRPSLERILNTPGLIDSVYADRMVVSPSAFFQNPTYGDPNKNPAPRGGLYQRATTLLSYTLPIWILLVGWVVGWLKKRPKQTNAGIA
jgi:hypothetical protein